MDIGKYALHDADKVEVVCARFPAEVSVIARSAQVAVLRECADELNAAGNRRLANEAEGWHYASDYVANKADALEAGAGQPEVRDGA